MQYSPGAFLGLFTLVLINPADLTRISCEICSGTYFIYQGKGLAVTSLTSVTARQSVRRLEQLGFRVKQETLENFA